MKALLTNKYGKRQLSDKIKSTEYTIIKNEVINCLNLNLSVSLETETDHYKIENIFEECYKLDVNEEQNHYYLLPISNIIKDFKSPNPILAQNGQKFWSLVESKIEDCLRLGAQSAYQKHLIGKESCDKYCN